LNATLEHGLAAEEAHFPAGAEERRRIAEHLAILLSDPLFANSKRIPAFLRHVVQEALDGLPEHQIKERTLGIVVFSRSADYDTNADPVVRMTAGEVRKKLAQYYYANPNADVQIEIPVGSYMPRFRFAHPAVLLPVPASEAPLPLVSNPPAEAEPVVTVAPRRHFPAVAVLLGAGLVALLVVGIVAWRGTYRQSAVDRFWSTFGAPSRQVLLVLPALSRAPQALPTFHFEAESVAIEDAEVASRISNELNARKLNSHLVLATSVDLEQLRSNPFVLIGALDNIWSMRLSQSLPFAFERSQDRRYGRIVDRKNPNVAWTEDFSVPNTQIPQDYGIIARFTDSTTEQPALLIAGISAEGTLAAGEAVSDSRYLDMLLKAAGNPHGGFEAVIQTRVIEGESGPPQIVAMRTW
jgi:hypothetical protein